VYPLVCPLSATELLVLGGFDGAHIKSDAFVVDVIEKTAEKVVSSHEFRTAASSMGANVHRGIVCSLLVDYQDNLQLTRFSHHDGNSSLEAIEALG